MMPPLMDPDRRVYLPGQMVPISGIYTAVHQAHRADHQVLAIRGEEFPLCRFCGEEVRFHVARVVPHMTHDFDMAGPRWHVRRGRAKAANGSD